MDDALSIADLERLVGGRVESIDPIEKSMIDKDFLLKEIASLEQQRANALQTVHMASGAIEAYRALIGKLEQNAKPADEPEQRP